MTALRPFVHRVWTHASSTPAPFVERVLPTGSMHLVVRLDDAPLTLFDDERRSRPRIVGTAVVGGARSAFYVREVVASRSVGVQLAPGAARHLFGVPAGELAETHTALDDLWGRAARELRERLATAKSDEARVACLERVLGERLAGTAPDPLVVHAIARIRAGDRIADVVAASGLGARAFIARFRDAVGLAPKAWARVVRAQRAIALLRDGRALGDVALDAGYSDQAHFTRELRQIGGVSPGRYRALAPSSSNHVPVR